MSGLISKVKDLVTGHSKGDDGTGDYKNSDFDETAYRKEKYGSESGTGQAPYDRGTGGQLLDKDEIAQEDPAAAYSTSSSLPTGSQGTSSGIDSGVTDSSSAGISSGITGSTSSTTDYDPLSGKGHDQAGLARSAEFEIPVGDSLVSSAEFETPVGESLGSSAEFETPVGGLLGSSAIAGGLSGGCETSTTTTTTTTLVGGGGEVLPGPSGITGAINENDPAFAPVLAEVKKHGFDDHGL